jgi:hypothetical protein
MLGSFERWFKQCDESILNDAAATTSGNISLGKTPGEMCLCGARDEMEPGNDTQQSSEAMKLGNLGRVDYLSSLTDIAGVRRQ